MDMRAISLPGEVKSWYFVQYRLCAPSPKMLGLSDLMILSPGWMMKAYNARIGGGTREIEAGREASYCHGMACNIAPVTCPTWHLSIKSRVYNAQMRLITDNVWVGKYCG